MSSLEVWVWIQIFVEWHLIHRQNKVKKSLAFKSSQYMVFHQICYREIGHCHLRDMGIYNVWLVPSNLAEYLGLITVGTHWEINPWEKIRDPAGIRTQDLLNTPSWIPDFLPWIYFSLSQQKKKKKKNHLYSFSIHIYRPLQSAASLQWNCALIKMNKWVRHCQSFKLTSHKQQSKFVKLALFVLYYKKSIYSALAWEWEWDHEICLPLWAWELGYKHGVASELCAGCWQRLEWCTWSCVRFAHVCVWVSLTLGI